MPLDETLRKRLGAALTARGTAGAPAHPRLLDDAARLGARVRRFVAAGVGPPPAGAALDADAMELCAYALQLPLRAPARASAAAVRTTMRGRCEDAAELLVAEFAAHADAGLLDRAARVLAETPQRQSARYEPRLLADVLNLDDFGVIGLAQQVILLAGQGQGVVQLAEGLEKREQYGYWSARLNDGFHFDAVREMARRRLEHARAVAKLLRAELAEDGG